MNDAVDANTFDTLDLVVAPPHQIFVHSWTAYIRPSIVFLLFLTVGYTMATIFLLAGVVWLLLAVALFAYQALLIRSVKLYTDDHGVWLFSGIFPWSKGVGGVKWRDLDEATYSLSFFSWAFKAYSLRIGHRFTKASELLLTNIDRGDDAVLHINRMHLQLINQAVPQVQQDEPTNAAN